MAQKRASANWLLLILLFAIAGAAVAAPVCGIELEELNPCLPAVNGKSPPPPTQASCSVLRKVDIPCLGFLPKYGIDPTLVYAMMQNCGIRASIHELSLLD